MFSTSSAFPLERFEFDRDRRTFEESDRAAFVEHSRLFVSEVFTLISCLLAREEKLNGRRHYHIKSRLEHVMSSTVIASFLLRQNFIQIFQKTLNIEFEEIEDIVGVSALSEPSMSCPLSFQRNRTPFYIIYKAFISQDFYQIVHAVLLIPTEDAISRIDLTIILP